MIVIRWMSAPHGDEDHLKPYWNQFGVNCSIYLIRHFYLPFSSSQLFSPRSRYWALGTWLHHASFQTSKGFSKVTKCPGSPYLHKLPPYCKAHPRSQHTCKTGKRLFFLPLFLILQHILTWPSKPSPLPYQPSHLYLGSRDFTTDITELKPSSSSLTEILLNV